MYVTSEMANRWKKIHWLQIDKRCWEATYGPNSQGSAHLREAKDDDGKPWPEWTGEQPSDHPDNEARETARKELERDLIIPDYTEIVGATAGHLMSTAAEAVMAHLSTFIFLRHARQKTERYSVGEQSPQADRKRVDDYVRRIGDQIEMVQYIRGRIGCGIGCRHESHTRLPRERVGCHQDFPKERGRADPRMRRVNMPWSQRRSAQGWLMRQRNAVLVP
jgi:hypothetical protein